MIDRSRSDQRVFGMERDIGDASEMTGILLNVVRFVINAKDVDAIVRRAS